MYIKKMKRIDSNKIVGVRIWENEDRFHEISNAVFGNNNSFRVIEFKTLEDVDKLINKLKRFKKDFIEIVNNGH